MRKLVDISTAETRSPKRAGPRTRSSGTRMRRDFGAVIVYEFNSDATRTSKVSVAPTTGWGSGNLERGIVKQYARPEDCHFRPRGGVDSLIRVGSGALMEG